MNARDAPFPRGSRPDSNDLRHGERGARVALPGTFAAALALALAAPAVAQTDPYRARVRGLTEFQYPTYQGVECTFIAAPRAVVWDVLSSAERAPLWLLAELGDVNPVRSRFRKGAGLAKDDVLAIGVNTPEGPRSLELTVLAVQEKQLVSFTVTKDEGVATRDVVRLTYTLVLEDVPGGTDLYWAAHYDPDSPLAAALSPLSMVRQHRARILAGLLTIRSLAESAVENAAPELASTAPTPPPLPAATKPAPSPLPARRKK